MTENVVSVADALRSRFQAQVARYRELVAKSVDTGGVLSEAEMAELVRICEALNMPAHRFDMDRTELMGLRVVEARLLEVQTKNATPVADVPALDAELSALSAEFSEVRGEADRKCREIEEKMAAVRREIRKEAMRFREPTDRWEREIIERRDANPVMFQRVVEPGEWADVLRPRSRTIRG